MPKLGLSLNLHIPQRQPNHAQQAPAANHQANKPGGLSGKQDVIAQQVKDLPTPVFRPAVNPPSFEVARNSGWGSTNNGWDTSNIVEQDSFIHTKRLDATAKGDFAGDKVHLSIEPSQVPAAFDTINTLLFSEDSPVDKWKVTDMTRVTEGSRVQVGAQFT